MAAGDWKELISAIHAGDMALVQYHVQQDINLNYQHPELLTTPLIESIISNQLEIATYLLAHGADPHLRAGFSTDTAFTTAKQMGNSEMIKLLRPYKKPWWRLW